MHARERSSPVEAERAFEVVRRTSPGVAVVGVEPQQCPHCDPHRELARPVVDVDPLDEGDAKFLRGVVERHQAETGSPVAAKLLADWDPVRFTKIMPKDYKRVMSAASQAEREGRDVNQAVMAAAHG